MITDLKINAERKQFYYEKGYWTEKTLGDVWADRVASHPERTYVSDDQGSSYTYGEIDDKAARLAAWLVDGKGGPGTWSRSKCYVGGVLHRLCGSPQGRRGHAPSSAQLQRRDLVYGMNLVGSRAFICPTKVAKVDFESQILSIVDQIPSWDLWRSWTRRRRSTPSCPRSRRYARAMSQLNTPPPSRLTT